MSEPVLADREIDADGWARLVDGISHRCPKCGPVAEGLWLRPKAGTWAMEMRHDVCGSVFPPQDADYFDYQEGPPD